MHVRLIVALHHAPWFMLMGFTCARTNLTETKERRSVMG